MSSGEPIPFCLAEVPLAPGTLLLEASAGTGKTWSLTGLVCRLIAEQSVPLREIVAVTFTEAATAELRERLRLRLADEATAAEAGGQLEAARRLRSAQLRFDEANIFTIHSFCLRLLREHALEAGLPTRTTVTTDDSALLQVALAAAWRQTFAHAPAEHTTLALAAGLTQAAARAGLQRRLRYPTARRQSQLDRFAALLHQAAGLWAELCQSWPAVRPQLALWLQNHKPNKGAKEAAAGLRLAEENGALPTLLPEVIDCCVALADPDAWRKSKGIPNAVLNEPWLQQAAALAKVLAELKGAGREALAEIAEKAWQTELETQGALTFDGILRRLHAALEGLAGGVLRRAVQARYRAALVDEYQDTDPVQARIFQILFDSPHHWLMLVGDPKQAIYGFRGADVYAYLNVAEGVARRYVLESNHRSSRGLIDAVNAVWVGSTCRFARTGAAFRPVRPGPKAERFALLRADGTPLPPLCLSATPEGATEPQAVAALIAEALRTGWQLHGQPLRPGEIAVLARANGQLAEVGAALAALGLDSVRYHEGSLFATEAAGWMRALLAAMADPTDSHARRIAWATPALGGTARRVRELAMAPAPVQEEATAPLTRASELWHRRGLAVALRYLLSEGRVADYLLALPQGTAHLAHWQQLSELLAAQADRTPPTALLRQLAAGEFETELAGKAPRLPEAGPEAVRLLTIHKSKGLEFPLVFVLGQYRSAPSVDVATQIVHDDDGTVRLGEEGRTGDAERVKAEQAHEADRLFYVALTRAQEFCQVVATKPNSKARNGAWNESPLGRMLGPWTGEWPDRAVALAADGRLHLASVPPAAPVPARALPAALAPVERPAPVPSFRAVTLSFSAVAGVAATRVLPTETPTPDATETADEPAPAPVALAAATVQPLAGAHALPRDVRLGKAWHGVLEQAPWPDLATLTQAAHDALLAQGLPTEGAAALAEATWHWQQAPLPGGFRLVDLPPENRRAEYAFAAPAALGPGEDLEALPVEVAAALRVARQAGRLAVAPELGAIVGTADLLVWHEGRFWLVDWKSNYLGPGPDSYHPEALATSMTEHHYRLQYLLYLAMLDRHWQRVLPGYRYETHVGGVVYVYLRGALPADPSQGVFFDRPAAAAIAAMQRLLLAPPPPAHLVAPS